GAGDYCRQDINEEQEWKHDRLLLLRKGDVQAENTRHGKKRDGALKDTAQERVFRDPERSVNYERESLGKSKQRKKRAEPSSPEEFNRRDKKDNQNRVITVENAPGGSHGNQREMIEHLEMKRSQEEERWFYESRTRILELDRRWWRRWRRGSWGSGREARQRFAVYSERADLCGSHCPAAAAAAAATFAAPTATQPADSGPTNSSEICSSELLLGESTAQAWAPELGCSIGTGC
ncbi:Protein of unknown function, partial [Gryllus bimaculatus]